MTGWLPAVAAVKSLTRLCGFERGNWESVTNVETGQHSKLQRLRERYQDRECDL
jgi:hypothetical protein